LKALAAFHLWSSFVSKCGPSNSGLGVYLTRSQILSSNIRKILGSSGGSYVSGSVSKKRVTACSTARAMKSRRCCTESRFVLGTLDLVMMLNV
jgi:hypothetical protein